MEKDGFAIAKVSWDEDRLVKLIQDGIEESSNLDYKAAGALARDSHHMAQITKDISAMANADGGILIYGIFEHRDDSKKHLPERLDAINRDEFSKEWLEHVVAAIRPQIPNLKIHSVQLKSGANHVAYVVEVPKGTTAHQANDFRYYQRYNFESKPMYDHQVRDVMNRKTIPQVSIQLKLNVFELRNENGDVGTLHLKIQNETEVFARYVAMVIHSPLKIRGKVIQYRDSIYDTGDFGWAHRVSYSNHIAAPLFPKGSLSHLFYFYLPDSVRWRSKAPEKELDHFRWVAFADAMPMQYGTFTVEEVLSTPIQKIETQ